MIARNDFIAVLVLVVEAKSGTIHHTDSTASTLIVYQYDPVTLTLHDTTHAPTCQAFFAERRRSPQPRSLCSFSSGTYSSRSPG